MTAGGTLARRATAALGPVRFPQSLMSRPRSTRMGETETYTVAGPDGDEESFELPAGLVDVLSEQGEPSTAVVSDVVVQAMAQQAHAIVHHSEGDVPEDIAEMNETAAELFEERFGQPLEEALGHSH